MSPKSHGLEILKLILSTTSTSVSFSSPHRLQIHAYLQAPRVWSPGEPVKGTVLSELIVKFFHGAGGVGRKCERCGDAGRVTRSQDQDRGSHYPLTGWDSKTPRLVTPGICRFLPPRSFLLLLSMVTLVVTLWLC